MKINSLCIKDVYTVKSTKHVDHRGWFQEVFNNSYEMDIKQINVATSKQHTIRGIHQSPYAKLCTCVTGRIYDVVVDLRPDSNSYGEWMATWLTGTEQVYVPAYCGHAYYAADENNVLVYTQDGIYNPHTEKNYRYDSFGVVYPKADRYLISDKDLLEHDIFSVDLQELRDMVLRNL